MDNPQQPKFVRFQCSEPMYDGPWPQVYVHGFWDHPVNGMKQHILPVTLREFDERQADETARWIIARFGNSGLDIPGEHASDLAELLKDAARSIAA